jgi:hypothetical protein
MEAGGLSLLDRPVFALSEEELLSRLDLIVAEERRLAAVRLETVFELAGRGIAAKRGFASAGMWLQHQLKVDGGVAGRMYQLSASLQSMPDVAEALASGQVSKSQAGVIASAVDGMKRETSSVQQAEAARLLIERAKIATPADLRRAGNGLLEVMAPEAAEERERKALEDSEKRDWADRCLTLSRDSSGRTRVKGWLTAEAAAIFRSVLDPLCNPARSRRPGNVGGDCSHAVEPSPVGPLRFPIVDSPDADGFAGAGDSGVDAGGAGDSNSLTGDLAGSESSGPVKDERTAGQRRHDALVEALELLLAGGDLPDNGGSRAQLTVTAPFDLLRQELKAGTLDTGERLSAEAVRRLACDAGIIPAVLDGAGVPLDLGRERRLISGHLRRALVLRDRGCAFPGCDRPPRWCQGHHPRHWSSGGKTSLDNSLLLCGFHHRLIHHGDWTVVMGEDGLPDFYPPSYFGENHGPLRNHYWARE